MKTHCIPTPQSLHWELNLFDHPVYGDWVGHDPSLGYDLLDGPNKRLHANFQVSASVSKKVLIFFQKKFHVNFSTAVTFFQKIYLSGHLIGC